MKKSLSRVLSLALVLVMVLGMMPMALATEGEKQTVEFASVKLSADSVSVVKGKTATVTVTEAIAKDNDQLSKISTSWSSSDEAIATVADGVITGVAAGSTTVSVIVTFDGELANYKTTKTVPVTVTAPAFEVEASISSATYKTSDTAVPTVSVVVKDANDDPVTNPTISWTTDNANVTVVDGKVNVSKWPDKDTDVVLIATYTVGGVEYKDSCKLSLVISKMYIDQKSVSHYETGSVKLEPVLRYSDTDKAVADATYTFSRVRGRANLAPATDGLSAVVSDSDYSINVFEIKAYVDNKIAATTEIAVSFYGDFTIYVDANDSKFHLAEKNVLSDWVVDGYPENWDNASVYQAMEYLTVDDAHFVKFWTSTNSTASGKLATSSTTDITDGISLNSTRLEYISFEHIPGKTGDAIIYFELTDNHGAVMATGSIEVEFGEAKADITYKTNFSTSVTVDEEDFYDYYYYHGGKGTLDYVEFAVDADIPEIGALYTTASTSTRSYVTARMDFHYSYSATTDKGTNDYDLDTVTYVPYSKAPKAYADQIPFTCVSTTGETLTGILEIQVNEDLPFTDVKKTDWFYENVAYVYNNNIMNGTSTTKFSPNDTLTRGMVVTMLYRVYGSPTVNYGSSFTDLKQDWYKDAVAWAARNGIVTGRDTKTFAPDAAITRQDLAVILYRYADFIKDSTYSNQTLTGFTDYKSVSSYATDALEWAVYEGIVTGSAGKLMPTGSATRAQAAAMFHRFLED